MQQAVNTGSVMMPHKCSVILYKESDKVGKDNACYIYLVFENTFEKAPL